MAERSRTVHLLRHAKSNWDADDLLDHDRPLAPRGRKAAAALAAHYPAAGVRPDLVLCSSSARTLETLERSRPGLPENVPVVVEAILYGASATSLLRRLQALPDAVGEVLLIGHNPGIGELAAGLVDVALGKFPTGALATVRFEGDWAGLSWGRGELLGYVVPRDLG